MQNPFTRCPNGDITDGGSAHDFESWPSMIGDFIPSEPFLFCRRCGEVRALRLAPVEVSTRVTALTVTNMAEAE